MNLAVISFTSEGTRWCQTLKTELSDDRITCTGYVLERFFDEQAKASGFIVLSDSLTEWTKTCFSKYDGIIFIGAIGIAVRAIAPYIKSKTSDPAVVVVDTKGRYAISLLSGHFGGANDLAKVVADRIGAIPIITTATDLDGKFAVDVFAKEQGLWMDNVEVAKHISADLLEGNPVWIQSDFELEGKLPEGIFARGNQKKGSRGIWITTRCKSKETDDTEVLRLIPRVVTIGIGCKQHTSAACVKSLVSSVLSSLDVETAAIAAVASIDLKKKESGIIAMASELAVPYLTYTPKELMAVSGEFTDSEFVRETTGVGNVCERAAVLAAQAIGGEVKLLIKKQSNNGVTVAAATGIPTFMMWEKR